MHLRWPFTFRRKPTTLRGKIMLRPLGLCAREFVCAPWCRFAGAVQEFYDARGMLIASHNLANHKVLFYQPVAIPPLRPGMRRAQLSEQVLAQQDGTRAAPTMEEA
jgi:hypothetical protein